MGSLQAQEHPSRCLYSRERYRPLCSPRSEAPPRTRTEECTGRVKDDCTFTSCLGSYCNVLLTRILTASSTKDTTRALLASMRKGPDGARSEDLNALKVYLEASPLITIKDPLAYWNGLLNSGSDSPELARMALDILSIPGTSLHFVYPIFHLLMISNAATSTDVERAFSCGRLTVSRLCRSLSDKSVHANTVLGSWASIPNLVHESELIALFDPQARKVRREIGRAHV